MSKQAEPQWECRSCGINNRRTALSCRKCRASRAHASPWECTQCHHPNLGTMFACNKCQYDRNGLTRSTQGEAKTDQRAATTESC